MRRFYQERWFGLAFSSFADPSFFRLADPRFYERFYEALFRTYPSWETLPQTWRAAKSLHAAWLARQGREIAAEPSGHERDAGDESPLRVLSVGSGLGYVEYNFLKELPEAELHINESSTVSLEWIRAHVPFERIHIGTGLSVLPADMNFDLIYLSAAEYFLRRDELTLFLAGLRSRLTSRGRLIMLSASLQEEETPMTVALEYCKILLYSILHVSGIRRRQFWGWLRRRGEYAAALQDAGCTDIRSGQLEDQSRTFWISGR